MQWIVTMQPLLDLNDVQLANVIEVEGENVEAAIEAAFFTRNDARSWAVTEIVGDVPTDKFNQFVCPLYYSNFLALRRW